MKLSRRNFLALGAGAACGGALGTMLSPLPWKLTDDLSIWTQDWPGTPHPPGGPESVEKTVCDLCPGACGLEVRKAGDRCVGIRGIAGHPVNDGGLCPLGAASLQLLYGPSRITGPLRRAGKRGEGRWKALTWRDATAEASGKLEALRRAGKAHLLALVTGRKDGVAEGLFSRFMAAFGSPNVFYPHTAWDTLSRAASLVHGADVAPGYDLEKADLVVSFGAGLLEGWGSPVASIRAHSAWTGAGGRLVQVEPRLSNTAAKADEWLAAKPGTEGALALGMAHVMIRDGLVNPAAAAAAKNLEGPQGFKALVMSRFSPEKVAKITGLSAGAVESLGRAFGKAKKPIAVWGRGKGGSAGLLRDALAVHALNVLAGRVNAAGGVMLRPADPPPLSALPAPFLDAAAIAGISKGRADYAGSRRFPLTDSLLARLPALLSEKGAEPLSALMVLGADPFHDLPEAGKAREVFGKIPFIVYFGTHFNDTARMADLVLPDNFFLESWRVAPTPPGFPRRHISLVRPVAKPFYNTRQAGDSIMEIARVMGGSMAKSFQWPEFANVLSDALGPSLPVLMKEGFREDTAVVPAAAADLSPMVAHKFLPQPLALFPRFQPPPLSGKKEEFPLLAIPVETLRLFTGQIGDPPYLVKALPDTVLVKNDLVVEINPETARKLGLSEGSAAKLSTPAGGAAVRVHLYPGIMPGLVGVPKGLGYSNSDDAFLSGRGANYEALATVAPDPDTEQDAAWATRAKITPV